jgi:anhydro-N-acetylmuramic acid kinase
VIVAGIMSGTSADGINVAFVRVGEGAVKQPGSRFCGRGRTRHKTAEFKFLAHAEFPYPKNVRSAVLEAMNATHAMVADLARLNFLLGELYAEAVLTAQRQFHLKAELIGCHGQTLYHQGEPESYLGRKLAVTWQTGEAATIAARVGVPVISDFRPADMAAGGKGAPLVPFLDYLFYRDQRLGRIAQNIGGIANLTAIPAGASPEEVLAFDTGPGNMVIDAVTEHLFGKRYDPDGEIAASGTPLGHVVDEVLRQPFFRQKPPKTTGREEFGREFVVDFVEKCAKTDARNVVATATALTARSIADALQRFVLRNQDYREFIVSGGGAKNSVLVAMLANELRPLDLHIRSSDEFGLPSEAKEAAAFALLAYETWNHRPSNVPSATGARRPAVLGKTSYA